MEAAQPASPQRKRIAVGDVIGETFSIYSGQLGVLLGSALAIFVVIGLVSGLLRNGGLVLIALATIVQFIGYALFTGFVVELVRDVRDGRRDSTVGDLFEAATPFIAPLVVFGILYGLAVGIGFVFFVVPGLVLVTFWAVGAPAIVVEKAGAIDAFGRSRRLVSGNAWAVFGVLLVTLLIVLAVQIVLAAIADPIGNGAVWIASIVSGALTAPVFAIVASVLYFDLAGDDAPGSIVTPSSTIAEPQPPPSPEPPPPPPPAAG